MKMHIENIGAIEKIDVDFDGITIIGGENNTGKSTIGKAVFACYQNMAEWTELYYKFVTSRIEKYLENKSAKLEDFCLASFSAKKRRSSRAESLRRKYSENEDFRIAIEDYQVTLAEKVHGYEELKLEYPRIASNIYGYIDDYCRDYLHLYSNRDEEYIIVANKKFMDSWTIDVIEGIAELRIDELDAQATIINSSFENIFDNQHIRFESKTAKISIIDKDERKNELRFESQQLYISAPIRTTSHVYYLESPKVYDLLSRPIAGMTQTTFLRMLLSPNFIQVNPLFYTDLRNQSSHGLNNENIISKDSLLDELQSLMGGRADYFQKIGIEFKDRNIGGSIHAQNVSTGLKSIALLEYALRIGVFVPGDVLILDEPEINLHPKWQIEYAKALVMLQKKYDIKMVISSHSPFFIRAIEIFCDKNDTMDCLNVYLTERNENNGVIGTNLSYSEYGMSELYDLLAAPLDMLESMLEES